ncbi:MAG TPA: hypothetical protein VFV83_10515 [Chthoniobacteraceae bacterium]|nr:hypothetical protein [Chthoniobacteraceae bacterium]
MISRRHFLHSAAASGALLGLNELRLPRVSAADAVLPSDAVRLDSGIEPMVRLIEETPRERLLEEIGARIRKGLAYREVLAGLLLAGVRNIQPRPVGFKFHAVLVVNSAHLASLSSPEEDRWLPIFWALDYFKDSQAADAKAGDWTLGPVEEKAVPSAENAKRAFTGAMDRWDESAADAAVAGLVRSATPQEIFEIFARYGARDFRDIGHKAIYVANSWRTLQVIGWQHAEPVLRSLAYALLERGGAENPAESDLTADRPWRRNLPVVETFRADWTEGKRDENATKELLSAARDASDQEISKRVVESLGRGTSADAIWDAVFASGAEMTMRRPNILSLHAVTTANALHFAYRTCRNDNTRRMLLLQAASFMPLFRGGGQLGGEQLDVLEPKAGANNLEAIFAQIGPDKIGAARSALAYLREARDAKPFIDMARKLIFLKGNNAHDYKFSSAVLEDYGHIASPWRERYLAATVFLLKGTGAPENKLVKRTRAALAA